MSSKTPERILTHWLPVFGIVSVMLYYAVFLYQHALNIPYADDIRDILLFLTDVSKSHEWAHTVELFFAQINDHRTLSSRLVYYLAFVLEGEANFRTLIFLANLALPLFLLMLYLPIRQQPNALLMLLPAALILFQLRLYGTGFWSMNAFAFMFVFVYGFAALLCLRELNPARFVAAVLFAALATFTLASGQLIWLVGFACVAHQALIVRRAPKAYMAAWLFAAIAVLAIYRIGYIDTNSIAQHMGAIPAVPREIALFFLVSLGLAVSEGNVVLTAGTGVALLLAVAWLTMRRWRGENITLELFAWYIILSLSVIALARVSAIFWGYTAGDLPAGMSVRDVTLMVAFSPRYAFCSVLLLATTTVLLVSQLQGGRRLRLAINSFIVLLAFTYCVSSYAIYPAHLQGVLQAMVGGHNSRNYWAFGDTTNESSVIVREAEELGIYHPPARPLPMPNLTGSTQGRPPRPTPIAREEAR